MHIYVRMSIHILFEWVSVMHISVRIAICSQFLSNAFLLNGNSEFLGVFTSNVSVSPCVQCSPTREYHGAVTNYKRYNNVYTVNPTVWSTVHVRKSSGTRVQPNFIFIGSIKRSRRGLPKSISLKF